MLIIMCRVERVTHILVPIFETRDNLTFMLIKVEAIHFFMIIFCLIIVLCLSPTLLYVPLFFQQKRYHLGGKKGLPDLKNKISFFWQYKLLLGIMFMKANCDARDSRLSQHEEYFSHNFQPFLSLMGQTISSGSFMFL